MAVAAAGAAGVVHAPAPAFADPAEFQQNLLAVADAAGYLVGRFGGQQQGGLRQQFGRFAARVVHTINQMVKDGAGRGHYQRRGYGRYRDAVFVHFLGQPLRKAFQGRFFGSVAGAIVGRRSVGAASRPDGGAGGYIDDAAGTPFHHIAQYQLAEDKGGVEVDGPGAHPAANRKVFDGEIVSEGGVIHQHIHRPIDAARFVDQQLAVLRQGYVGGHGSGLAAGCLNIGHRFGQRTFQGMIAFVHGAGGADDARALGGEQAADFGADAAAGAGYNCGFSFQSGHLHYFLASTMSISDPGSGSVKGWPARSAC